MKILVAHRTPPHHILGATTKPNRVFFYQFPTFHGKWYDSVSVILIQKDHSLTGEIKVFKKKPLPLPQDNLCKQASETNVE